MRQFSSFSHPIQPEPIVDEVKKVFQPFPTHHKFKPFISYNSDSTQMTVVLDQDFKLNTVPWHYSLHVVGLTQMQVESCPLLYTQMPTQN